MKIIRILGLLIVLAILFNTFSVQQFSSRTLQEAQEDVERTRTQVVEFEKLIEDMKNELVVRAAHIESLEKELAKAQADLQNAKSEMKTTEAEKAENLMLFSSRLRSSYMKSNISFIEVLLQAESFSEIFIWFVYLTRILENDANIINDLENQFADLAQKRSELDSKIMNLSELRDQIEIEYSNLIQQREEKETLLAQTKDRLETELAEIARLSPRADHKPVYAVVIDNISYARPQHGLSKASIVYEYEVEGGVTRYLALFAELPSKVGPVRSARLHSATIALEHNVSFVHAGGGGDVLRAMRTLGVKSVNELVWDGEGFSRDRSRRAPHNLYVNLARLRVEEKSNQFIMRPAYLGRIGTGVRNFTIEFNRRHIVNYSYNPQREAYAKSINTRRVRDANGNQIFARNIIVLYVPYKYDLFRRPTAQLIGEGKLEFYALGQFFEGFWQKTDTNSPMRFFHSDGEEIERVYGQTWIHLVNSNQ